ncbi:hypothetical protein BOW52_00180 [Solemya elarraichensis gill symbiont]|uniref:Death domain-containing protein n=1 Tax=Solemya elarraichensis gill symbiont TaxID=1918949 RepID=A0A1T2LDM1_9GAMM|nr:hypothetical protein BOW52_00180 [Solemya elarraichensis gill symbiont]
MAVIPDINKTEKWLIETTLKEGYGETRPYQLADAEIRLQSAERSRHVADSTRALLPAWQRRQKQNTFNQ